MKIQSFVNIFKIKIQFKLNKKGAEETQLFSDVAQHHTAQAVYKYNNTAEYCKGDCKGPHTVRQTHSQRDTEQEK